MRYRIFFCFFVHHLRGNLLYSLHRAMSYRRNNRPSQPCRDWKEGNPSSCRHGQNCRSAAASQLLLCGADGADVQSALAPLRRPAVALTNLQCVRPDFCTQAEDAAQIHLQQWGRVVSVARPLGELPGSARTTQAGLALSGLAIPSAPVAAASVHQAGGASGGHLAVEQVGERLARIGTGHLAVASMDKDVNSCTASPQVGARASRPFAATTPRQTLTAACTRVHPRVVDDARNSQVAQAGLATVAASGAPQPLPRLAVGADLVHRHQEGALQ